MSTVASFSEQADGKCFSTVDICSSSNPDIKNGSARVEPPTEKPSADHNLGGYFAAVSVRVPAAVLREIKD